MAGVAGLKAIRELVLISLVEPRQHGVRDGGYCS